MGDIRPIGLTPVRTLIAGDSGINRTLVRVVERGSKTAESRRMVECRNYVANFENSVRNSFTR